MFQSAIRKPSSHSLPGSACQSKAVIQPAWRPGKLLHKARALKSKGEHRLVHKDYVELDKDEKLLVDDEVFFREALPEGLQVTEDTEYRNLWYKVLTGKKSGFFYLKDTSFEFMPDESSFKSMMTMLRQVYDAEGRGEFRPGIFTTPKEVEVSIRGMTVKPQVSKDKHIDAPDVYLQQMFDCLVTNRSELGRISFRRDGKPVTGMMSQKQYVQREDAMALLRRGPVHMLPPDTESKKSEHGEELKDLNSPAAARAEPDLAKPVRIFINAQAPFMHKILPVILRHLDFPDETGNLGVERVMVVGPGNIPIQTDPIIISVQSQRALDGLTADLKAMVEAHPEYVSNEVPFMTEQIAPGIGWGEEGANRDVWEMDERTSNSLKRYFARVGEGLRRNSSWTKRFWNSGRWSALEAIYAQVEVEVGSEATVFGLSKEVLLRMNTLSTELMDVSMSDYVEDWLKATMVQTSDDSISFRGVRVKSVLEGLPSMPISFEYQLQQTMRSFARNGVDFFSPHKTLSSFKEVTTGDWENMDLHSAEDGTDPSLGLSFNTIKGETVGVSRATAWENILQHVDDKLPPPAEPSTLPVAGATKQDQTKRDDSTDINWL